MKNAERSREASRKNKWSKKEGLLVAGGRKIRTADKEQTARGAKTSNTWGDLLPIIITLLINLILCFW